MMRIAVTLILTILNTKVSCSYQDLSSSSAIRNVAIVGGTHGNEYTGIWCIKCIDKKGPEYHKTKWPSLSVSTLLANPKAFLANKRFIDHDLNREFTHEKLTSGNLIATVESLRAREVHDILGPRFVKPKGNDDDDATTIPKTDLVIDLHSTTSNMGVTLIVPENDSLMIRAAAYVLGKCEKRGDVRILLDPYPDLSWCGKHGFTIEVGPVPQGVLRHDMVEKTQWALDKVLDFSERWNSDQDNLIKEMRVMYPDGRVPSFRMVAKLAWPCDPENPNFPAALVHASVQDRDFQKVRKGDPLFVNYDGSVIDYDGTHGDEVFLIFVNEGGYYYQTSGVGIGVATATTIDLARTSCASNMDM